MKSVDVFIREQALLNAIEHGGLANPRALVGRVLSEYSEYRTKVKDIMPVINRIVSEVNSLGIEKQKEEADKSGIALKKKEVQKGLPDLPNAVNGKVVMRFAPNPDGPLSIGRSRQILLNWLYTQRYGGKFILRLDDTDGKVKTPIKEAYQWIYDDVKWLGVKPDVVVKASDRFDIYYEYAEKLIKMDKAYVCTCDAEAFRKLKAKAIACPCRSLDTKENMKRWKDMFSKYKEGEAVLRIKTDIKHKNPAIRDWPAFRIIDKPKHPYLDVKVWPLYDYASAIDDSLLGVTHIIRGIDFLATEEKQGYLYKYFGWTYPVNIVTGKFLVSGVKSTSVARKLISEGKYTGWDDPRLGTLMALRRRGFMPDAIHDFIKATGITRGDINVSLETLYAFNKKYIDPKAERYFFVSEPVEAKITGAKPSVGKVPIHPDNPSLGDRNIKMNGAVLLSSEDLQYLKKGSEVRLKGLFNIKIISSGKKGIEAEFTSSDVKKSVPIIHWVPKDDNIDAMVLMPDASVKKGALESNCSKLKINDVVQLERFGFARVESIKPFRLVFGHK